MKVHALKGGDKAQEHFDSIEKTDGCWPWPGWVVESGYGRAPLGANARPRYKYAHIWVYERVVGPISAGMQIDHLCHTEDLSCWGGFDCPHRRCVNPDHLEAVPQLTNIARQQWRVRRPTCSQGHEYAGDNLKIRKDGGRICIRCRYGDPDSNPRSASAA